MAKKKAVKGGLNVSEEIRDALEPANRTAKHMAQKVAKKRTLDDIIQEIAKKEIGKGVYVDSKTGEVAIPIPATGRATKPFFGVLHLRKSGDSYTMKFQPYPWFLKRFEVLGVKIKAEPTDAPLPLKKPRKPPMKPLRVVAGPE